MLRPFQRKPQIALWSRPAFRQCLPYDPMSIRRPDSATESVPVAIGKAPESRAKRATWNGGTQDVNSSAATSCRGAPVLDIRRG